MYRYLVVEYCFEDDSYVGKKNVVGSYATLKEARVAAGQYIKQNVKKMRTKYRDWIVDVQKERIFFDIKGL